MSRLRTPIPPAIFSPNSPNQVRHALRYAELYNNETLGVRALYPRPPLQHVPRSIPESNEPFPDPTASSYQHKDDGIRVSSSDAKEDDERSEYDAKDLNLSEEVVTVIDEASIHSLESLTPFKPNLNKTDEAYFSLDSVALTERSESDGTMFSSQRSIDLRLKSKPTPPAVAPRPTRTTPRRITPSQDNNLIVPPKDDKKPSEYIELQSLKKEETASDLESVSSKDDIIKSEKETETPITNQTPGLGLPIKSASAENLDRDTPKQDSPLLRHPEPLPEHLHPVDAIFRDRSPKSYHQSLPRIKDNKLKPYKGSTVSLKSSTTLSSRGDLSSSLRSLQRGLGSSTESTHYDHREVILDSYLLQKEHQNLIQIPTFDPDTTESEATDNEGFVPEPPSPPRERRPPETDTGPNRKIIVQDKFLPEDDSESGLIKRKHSSIRSEGTFISIEQENYQFTASDTDVPDDHTDEESIRTVYQPNQAPSLPQIDNLPPEMDDPIPTTSNRGRSVGLKTCCCIILGVSVILVLLAGISGMAAFFLAAGDPAPEPSITIHNCPNPNIIVKHLRHGQTERLVTWGVPYATDDLTRQRVEIISPKFTPSKTYFSAGMTEICYHFYNYRDSMQYPESCCFIVYVLLPNEGHGSSVSYESGSYTDTSTDTYF